MQKESLIVIIICIFLSFAISLTVVYISKEKPIEVNKQEEIKDLFNEEYTSDTFKDELYEDMEKNCFLLGPFGLGVLESGYGDVFPIGNEEYNTCNEVCDHNGDKGCLFGTIGLVKISPLLDRDYDISNLRVVDCKTEFGIGNTTMAQGSCLCCH